MNEEVLKALTGVRIPKSSFLPGLLHLAVHQAIPGAWRLTWEQRIQLSQKAAQLIAEKGDILEFGGGKKGEVTEVFARMAEAIACAAFCPGGIKVFGERYIACENCGDCHAGDEHEKRIRVCPTCSYDLTQPSKEKEDIL